ncbi:hypothetical protein Y032_0120g900 [Ancylostoma ceylanicum]|nr:hypothetical protein Y032_0120g900 [Ancylostoma ceylanicum]
MWSVAPCVAVAGDCDSGAHRLWAAHRDVRRTGDVRSPTLATDSVGGGPSLMLATATSVPIDRVRRRCWRSAATAAFAYLIKRYNTGKCVARCKDVTLKPKLREIF